jgi:tetratricopeptide (TPR) repeat protein
MTVTNEDERVLLITAMNCYYAVEYAQAVELFEKILVINPRNQPAKEYLRKAKSNKSLTERVKRVPLASAQYFRRARSYIAAKEMKLAIRSLETAIDLAAEAGIGFSEAEELLSKIRREFKQAEKAKVFISYSRKYDLEIAKEIYSFFLDNDCTPWMDIYDLIPGQDWESVIIDNIKSCDFFVACLSRHSVSTRGYLLKELKEAISMLEQIPEGEIYLIPIRIDDCVVPHSLTSSQWLDWSAPSAKTSLLKAVKSKK